MARAFNSVRVAKEKSMELESGCQTSSALNLFGIPSAYWVGFKGISIW